MCSNKPKDTCVGKFLTYLMWYYVKYQNHENNHIVEGSLVAALSVVFPANLYEKANTYVYYYGTI